MSIKTRFDRYLIGYGSSISVLFLLCLSILVVIPHSFSQEYFTTVQHYTVEDQLTDNLVTDIYQDSKGFIWIATASGINRFDGHDFQHYTIETHGLPSNNFHSILEDKEERLWFIANSEWNTSGLSFYTKKIILYDPVKDQISLFEDVFDVPFNAQDMRWIVPDDKGAIWISTKDGSIYKNNGDHMVRIFQMKVPDNWLGGFAVTSDGKLGILDDDQITVVDSNGNFLFSTDLPYAAVLIFPGKQGELWAYSTRSHYLDKGKLQIWLIDFNDKGVKPFAFKNQEGQPLEIGIEEGIYTSFKMDHKGRYWSFVDEQFFLFDQDGILLHDLTPILIENELPAESILYNFGINDFIWLATEKGVFSVALREKKFNTILTNSNYSIPGSITSDANGHILINQEDVFVLNKEYQIINRLAIPDLSASTTDENGNVWFADDSNGIYLYESKSGSLLTKLSPDLSLGRARRELWVRRFIKSLYYDVSNNRLFIGDRAGGIKVLNIDTREIVPFNGYNSFAVLKSSVINQFYKNSEGLWLSTNKGLFLLDFQDGIIGHYIKDKSGEEFTDVNHIYEDKEGVFWIATNGDGFIKWNRNQNDILSVTKQDGLSSNQIYAIYEDSLENLWMSSGYGLMQFDKKTENIFTWLEEDGLPSNRFENHFNHQTQDGQILFGTTEGGVISVYPKDLNSPEREVVITDYLELDNQTGLHISNKMKVESNRHIVIEPGINSVIIKISLLDYTNPADVKYGYQLKNEKRKSGTSESWIIQSDNNIRLSGLDYGKYNLEVNAKGTDNLRTRGVLNIPVIVQRPFYLQSWFLLLTGATLLSILALLFRWRTDKLEEDKRKLEKLVDARTQTIVDQKSKLEEAVNVRNRLLSIIGHDLRGPLFSLQGIEEQVNYLLETNQIARLKKMGMKIEKTTKQLTLTLNNLLNWSLKQMNALPYQPEKFKIYDSVENTLSLFESIAADKSIILKNHVLPDLEICTDQNAWDTIIRNLVSNSIKFSTSEDIIIISSATYAERLVITIKDSGCGISVEDQKELFNIGRTNSKKGTSGESGSGLGLVLVKELADIIGAKLDFKSTYNEGTKISIIFTDSKISN